MSKTERNRVSLHTSTQIETRTKISFVIDTQMFVVQFTALLINDGGYYKRVYTRNPSWSKFCLISQSMQPYCLRL